MNAFSLCFFDTVFDQFMLIFATANKLEEEVILISFVMQFNIE